LTDCLPAAFYTVFHSYSLLAYLTLSHHQGCREYSSIFYYTSTRCFLLPVANFHFIWQIFAVIWWTVGIYGNLGLRDYICNLPAWK